MPPVCECGHEYEQHAPRLSDQYGVECSVLNCPCLGFVQKSAQVINDPVNHPAHYTKGSIEVWDFVADQGLDFFIGNVVKYVSRAGYKDPTKEIEDLEKAEKFLQKKIKLLKKARDGVGSVTE